MWSFFKSKAGRLRDGTSHHPARVLLSEFAAIDQQRQQRTAEQIALLWSGFLEEFGGPRPFLDAPKSRQDAYLSRLDRIIELSRDRRVAELAHFHYSAAMLRLFLEALRTREATPEAVALSQSFAALIDRVRDQRAPADAA
jgi:hypothetical protein